MRKWWWLLWCVTLPLWAAPKSDLWPMWDASQSGNATISHDRWQQVLSRYVSVEQSQSYFDYGKYKASGQTDIQQYLSTLTAIDPRGFSREEQFAYWVNLYNALTVQLIIDNYPLASITKLGGFFQFGPWDDELVVIAGEALTLNDIEHRILRPIWQEPRIHYAVNCASLGCPDLLPHAYTAQNTETLLEEAARRFINSDKGVLINGDRAVLSSIYDWYGVDFKPSVKAHVNHYRRDSLLGDHRIDYEYDWDLNQRKP
ncbi:DUF547 domain-containing protein [Thaumasiovibrio subtropicus]|uniref:DUF547 domain-containing protein n=1 Tax=Thaumasiovibrio subtropicus TaxID=1891207 RepID=UPI000B36394A|nr:DUF547 domain-containing protein [Thaumasiovibrio subtropicus]